MKRKWIKNGRRAAAVLMDALEPRMLYTGVTNTPAGDEEAPDTDMPCVMDLAATQEVEAQQVAASSGAKIPVAGGVPVWHSNPGAFAKLILDFDGDGASQWGSYSVPATPAYDQDGDPTTFNTAELTSINEIYQRVAEKYSPFNIDVTTEDPGGTYANKQAVKIVIGGDGAWLGSLAGGISYIGSFYNSSINVSYVFPSNLANGFAKYTAEATAHEAGHAFGLQHQGQYSGTTLVQEYNPGNSQIAPIMGVSYYSARGLWWSGIPSNNPYGTQNDLSVISGTLNGFGYRTDDNGNSIATSTTLTVANGGFSTSGIIEQNTDSDYFGFTVGSGQILTLNLGVAQYGAMLDGSLFVYDSSGTLLASADTTSLTESLTFAIGAGTYYVDVTSHGGYGDIGQYTLTGMMTATDEPQQPIVLDDPRNLTATPVSSGEIDLAWTDTSGDETGFVIQRSSDNGLTWSNLGTTTASVMRWQDTSVLAGGTYKYRVEAVNGPGTSGWTAGVSATTTPAAPGAIAATANSATQVTVSWSDVLGETSFLIERSGDGVSGWIQVGTTGAGITSYVDSSVTGGNSYYYRVRASNGTGASGYTTVAGTLTLPAAPGTPLVSVVSSGELVVSWSGVNGATSYVVERSLDDNVWTTLSTTNAAGSYSDTSVSGGTQYFYRVRAVNGSGVSDASGDAAGLTLPEAPAGVSATANSASKITLVWGSVAGADAYVVERSDDGVSGWAAVATNDGTNTSYIDQSLAAETSYFYRVRAVNASGNSEYSLVATATTMAVPMVVEAPTALAAASESATSVMLSWQDNSTDEDGFVVQRSEDGGVTWVTLAATEPDVTNYQDAAVSGGVNYVYRVYAYSTSVVSEVSSDVGIVTVPATPGTPVVSGVSPGEIGLSWSAAPGATSYAVERSMDGVSGWGVIGTVDGETLTYSDVGLQAATQYYYRIRAINGAGTSEASPAAGVMTLQVIPTAPNEMSLQVVSNSAVRLEWVDRSSNESGFMVEYSLDGRNWKLAGNVRANTTAVMVTGLAAGRAYRFRVSAYNELGFSATSNVATVRGIQRALKSRGLAAGDLSAAVVLDIRNVRTNYPGLSKSLTPDAASDLTAVAYSTSAVQLTWSDNSDSELGFKVEYSVNGRGWKLAGYVGADQTGCRVTGLRRRQNYAFRVTAYNLAGAAAKTQSMSVEMPVRVSESGLPDPSWAGDQDTTLNARRVRKIAPGLLGSI